MDAFQFRRLVAAPQPGDQIAVYLTGTQDLVTDLVDLAGQPLANPFVVADADHWGFRPAEPAVVDVWWEAAATMLAIGEALSGDIVTTLTLDDATFDGRYLSVSLPSPVEGDKEVVVELSTDAVYFTVMGIAGNIACFFFFGTRAGLFGELRVVNDPAAAGVESGWDANNHLVVRCQPSATAQAVIDAIVAATGCEYHLQDLEQTGYDPTTTGWLEGIYHWYPDGPGSRWIDDLDHDAGVANELHQITPDGLMTLTDSAGSGWRWDFTGLGYVMTLGSTMAASGNENFGPTHYRAVISLANRDYQLGETKGYRSYNNIYGDAVYEDNAPYSVPLYLGRSRTDIVLRLDLGPPVATLWDVMFPLVAAENLVAPTLLTFTVKIRPLRLSDEVGVPLYGGDMWVTPEDGFSSAARVSELLLSLTEGKEDAGTAAAVLADHLAEDQHGTTAQEQADIAGAAAHAGSAHAPPDATAAGAIGDAHAATPHAPSDAEANSPAATIEQAQDPTGTTLLGWTAVKLTLLVSAVLALAASVFKGLLHNHAEKVQAEITTAVSSIDWSAGHVTINYAGNTNIGTTGFTSVRSGGRAYLTIMFKHNGGARTLTLPATVKSTITLAGTSGGWDVIVLWTDDGGTNIYGQVVESK